MRKKLPFFVLLCLFLSFQKTNAQTVVKKVIFQAFWWDYWNNNFKANWADYLTELTPRLKSYGIDALWLPPNSKAGGIGSMGYGASDPYDLGDKYQKYAGNTVNDSSSTRFGTKNSLLRTIAVLHANGMEAIQDVVLNHLDNAGSNTAAGGIDNASLSLATNGGYKNFNHVSYATPAIDETADDYYTRNGRWQVNYNNFYPNTFNPCCTNNINSPFFGPDISYESNAYGQSSNIPTSGTAAAPVNRSYYNPSQSSNYMIDGARDWLAWYKKQTGVDGMRWDAVKHFPIYVQQDLIRNIKYGLPSWAQGGNTMTNIGEWIGTSSELDQYVTDVAQPYGGYTYEEHTGTFDFNLRGYGANGGIYSMVLSSGGYNMQNLPGEQQGKRTYTYGSTIVNRTIPFVNSHDTYRPILDANGDFSKPLGDASGWRTGDELGGNGQHIDPREPRLAAAYATIFSLDGNPTVYFEDLFDIGTTGKRFSHLPTNTTDLPARPDIVNIIQAHQSLDFKDGSYGVPTSLSGGTAPFYATGNSGDHIVFERAGKALIGITDYYNTGNNNSNDEKVYITCQFPIGTVLYDYSGAHGVSSVTVTDNFGDFSNHRVLIQTAPVSHTIAGANGHGYSIWAPLPSGVSSVSTVQDLYNILANGIQANHNQTSQEWEMADDLGDSHCYSLGQGGALPASSTHQRVAGKIFAAAGKSVSYIIYPGISGNDVTASLWDNSGNKLFENNAVVTTGAPLTGTYTPASDEWITIKVRNTVNTQPSQKLFVRVTYTAPVTVNTLAPANAAAIGVSIWTGNKNTTDITDCGNWEEGKVPGAATNVIIPAYSTPYPVINTDMAVNNITIDNGAALTINSTNTLSVNGNWVNNNTSPLSVCGKVAFTGTATQQVYGKNTFCKLEINNTAGVSAQNDDEVSSQLILTGGKYLLNNSNLALQPGCTVTGGSATSYVQAVNAATGGFLIQEINSTPKNYPVGNTNYTPLTVTNNGVVQNCKIRCFEDVLAHGLTGTTISSTDKIKKTWEITPTGTGAVADVIFNWNTANHDATFVYTNCFVAKNTGGPSDAWSAISAQSTAAGSNPYNKTAIGISTFSKFSIFSSVTLLAVSNISFKGAVVQDKATLNWSFTSDGSVLLYNLQKSTDGIAFKTIATFTGSNAANFSFTDNDFSTASFYQLALINADGSIKNSNVVFLNKPGLLQKFGIAPNPVNNFVKISAEGVNAAELIDMQLLNISGSTVLTAKGKLTTIQNSVNKMIGSLQGGLYLIKLNTATGASVLKIVKQ